MHSFNEYIFRLNEGLIKTYNIDIVIDKLDYFFKDLKIIYDVYKNPSNEKIILEIENFNKIFNIIDVINIIENYFINISGWFPSSIKLENIHGMFNTFLYDKNYLITNSDFIKSIKITFESKFDLITKTPDRMYHLTINEFNDKIMKHGLVPKNKSKKSIHPERIYLCETIDSCEKLILQMEIYYAELKYKNKNLKIDINWIIYEVIIPKDIKLYKDPNYVEGFYTTDNIPSNCLKVVKRK
jgi:hypothetical protein